VFQTWNGERIENGFYLEFPSSPTVTDLSNLADDVNIDWQTYMLPVQSQDLALRGCYVLSLDTSDAPSVERFLAAPVDGSLTSNSLPNNVSLAIKFSTEQRGRARRGRMYFAGLTDAQVEGNTVTVTAAGAITSAVRDMIQHLKSVTSTRHVVISRTTQPATITEVTDIGTADRNIDSQRRRLAGRGQ
jgi:hypothetical protein